MFAQENKSEDKIENKFTLYGDVRVRFEQDWNSRKSDGSFRNDRTRGRYRLRVGMDYKYNEWVTVGTRIRTGNPMKQQDPHISFGSEAKEFGTLPLSLEKLYVKYKKNWFSAWIGKNTFPFEKQNELFWSDNVFPEGISLSGNFNFKNNVLSQLQVNAAHFIVISANKSMDSDSYFQGAQLVGSFFKEKLKIFPSFYYFHKMPDIPDGFGTFLIDYRILKVGTKFTLLKAPKITIGMDYMQNMENYSAMDSISKKIRNQKKGIVASLNIGELKSKNNWKFGVNYAIIERFAAVDYFAQNDWVRWDYSSSGSTDGRLTNFKGLELNAAYAIDKNLNLKLSCFLVEQLISYGQTKENGNRIRLDFNIKF